MKIKTWLQIGFVCCLTGCQLALPLPQPEKPDAIKRVSPATEQRKIAFAGGIFDIQPGELYVSYPYWHWSIPNVHVGYFICNTGINYRMTRSLGYWDTNENIFRKDWADRGGIFVERALAGLGYDIKQRKKSFFQDQMNRPSADLLLSMRIVDMKANMCYLHSPMVGWPLGRSGGNGVITVEWEVFDTVREKVLGSFMTQGYGTVDEPLKTGEEALLMSAIRDAAYNLGRTKWFYQMMTTMDPVDLIPATSFKPLTLTTRSRVFYKPIQNQYGLVRRSVISVRAEKVSRGAGFFINNEGYALTSAGVVGDAQTVQIMDSNGTKYRAKVLRKDDRRDVALLKADIKDNMSLPLSDQDWFKPTDTVYAVGTPFSNSYKTTVTQGIISAHRYHVHNGMGYIQASVGTAPGFGGGPLTDDKGNVIGIKTRLNKNAKESQFSLFIPIKDALEALNISLENEHF